MSFTEKILQVLEGKFLTSLEVFDRVERVGYLSTQSILKQLSNKGLVLKFFVKQGRFRNQYTLSDKGKEYLNREKKTIDVGVE